MDNGINFSNELLKFKLFKVKTGWILQFRVSLTITIEGDGYLHSPRITNCYWITARHDQLLLRALFSHRFSVNDNYRYSTDREIWTLSTFTRTCFSRDADKVSSCLSTDLKNRGTYVRLRNHLSGSNRGRNPLCPGVKTARSTCNRSSRLSLHQSTSRWKSCNLKTL